MAYDPDTPLNSSEDPSVTEPKFRENFQTLNTFMSVNHVDIETTIAPSTDEGKHKFLQMPDQASAPATAANEAGLFAQLSSLTSATELVFRRESNGTEIEFTGLLAADNGWSRLASGILIKWGTGTANGAATTSFPVAATNPVFSTVYSAQVSVEDSSGTPNTYATFQSFNTTGITVFGSSRTSTGSSAVTFRYLVIGD